MPAGETCSFHGFSLNRESFPANHAWPCRLAIQVHRNATVKVLPRIAIFHSKRKSFPLWMFSHIWYITSPRECDTSKV